MKAPGMNGVTHIVGAGLAGLVLRDKARASGEAGRALRGRAHGGRALSLLL